MKKGNILIVDDNKNVLSALRILLSDYFENIVLLTSPNTLMSELRDKNPDVVPQAVNACRRDAVANGMSMEDAMRNYVKMEDVPDSYK